MNRRDALRLGVGSLVMSAAVSETIQTKVSARAANRMKMTTDIPPSITTPDTVQTRIGTLKFFDGFPNKATVDKVYDNLDFQHGVQAYLTALPAVSIEGARGGVTGFGPANQTVLISEQLLDSRSLFLTANTTTPYTVLYLNTKDGPLVLEIPPAVLGPLDDAWFRWITDVGITGPDKGAGGKYLLLPPSYTGEVPDGYFVARSRTFGNLLLFRTFLKDGDPKPGVDSVKKNLRSPPGRKFFAPAIRTPRSIATINAARDVEASASRSSIASRHHAASGWRAWSARPRSLGCLTARHAA
jgi:hypothetical protein